MYNSTKLSKVKVLNSEYKIIVVISSTRGSRERIPPRSNRRTEKPRREDKLVGW